MKEIKFYIKTIGCKLNFAESSHISSFLSNHNLKNVENRQNADIFILNTCSVTGHAEKKCIQEIRAFNHCNPFAPIIVTGCFANLNCTEIEKENNVKIISGRDIQQKRAEILDFILHKENNLKISIYDNKFPLVWSNTRTRCFLKIQDGCDNKCAYCTVHLARGNSRSATIKEVCNAIENISDSGVKEIVLTGLNTADFGRLNGETFIELLEEIEKLNCVNRIRISSIEPNLLTKEIISFISKSKCFLPHFHIPLQAGNDKVLKLMERNYLSSQFSDSIKYIKKLIPDAFIGIDIIAGVNGETEEAFLDSYNFVKQLPISFLHVFPYSERPNTKAIDFSPIVTSKEKHNRVKKYIELSNSKLLHFYENNIGKTIDVLFESKTKNGLYQGFMRNYIKVEMPFSSDLRNKIVPVLLESINYETFKMRGK